jgi:hypothetical protein
MNTRCTCKKTSLHFDCWKATDGLARAGYSMTWLLELLYSHSDIVCLLIQTNCTELQPSINILIRVAWLFDQPVQATGSALQRVMIIFLGTQGIVRCEVAAEPKNTKPAVEFRALRSFSQLGESVPPPFSSNDVTAVLGGTELTTVLTLDLVAVSLCTAKLLCSVTQYCFSSLPTVNYFVWHVNTPSSVQVIQTR